MHQFWPRFSIQWTPFFTGFLFDPSIFTNLRSDLVYFDRILMPCIKQLVKYPPPPPCNSIWGTWCFKGGILCAVCVEGRHRKLLRNNRKKKVLPKKENSLYDLSNVTQPYDKPFETVLSDGWWYNYQEIFFGTTTQTDIIIMKLINSYQNTFRGCFKHILLLTK